MASTDGLKGVYFQGVETRALSTRGVKLVCENLHLRLTLDPRPFNTRFDCSGGELALRTLLGLMRRVILAARLCP